MDEHFWITIWFQTGQLDWKKKKDVLVGDQA